MEHDLITIVIPVYNVEPYLKRCLDSVLKQTYTFLDIILVDDGSTDNSGDICEQYSKLDLRIKVIHKENGGLSDARNKGIDAAKGKYITFIDSDDYIHECYISHLYKLLIDNQADIVCSSFINSSEIRNIYDSTSNRMITDFTKSYTTKEAFEALCYQNNITHSMCGKLFRTKYFEYVKFPIGKLYEDEAVAYQIIAQAQKIIWSSAKLYTYFQRKGGIIRSSFNVQKMDYIAHTEQFLKFINTNYPDLQEAAISKLLWTNLHVWLQIPHPKDYPKEYVEIKNTLTRYRRMVIANKNVRFQNRILLSLTYLGHGPLRLIYQLKNIIHAR